MSERAYVTVKDLATRLKTDPRTLRAFLRECKQGAGRGQRYGWASMSDAAVKAIVRDFEAAQASQRDAGATDTAKESKSVSDGPRQGGKAF